MVILMMCVISSPPGVLVSVLKVITKASYSDSTQGVRESSDIYIFLNVAFLLLFCIGKKKLFLR